jgi:hypothetical protein
LTDEASRLAPIIFAIPLLPAWSSVAVPAPTPAAECVQDQASNAAMLRTIAMGSIKSRATVHWKKAFYFAIIVNAGAI